LVCPSSEQILAVLPLANLSGDPGAQDYFADGMKITGTQSRKSCAISFSGTPFRNRDTTC